MSLIDISGAIFVICFSLSLLIMTLGEYSEKIVRIIKEIKRKF